jgi:hypothetical protein
MFDVESLLWNALGAMSFRVPAMFSQDLARARLRAEKYTGRFFLRIGHEAI